ncbi:MAG: hypothetical protein ABGY75_18090 [Gemmataceae bacterium]
MTRFLFALTAAAALAACGVAAEKKPLPKPDTCFGTTIDFVDTPKEAAAKAKKEEKLVFVLHVSGNFEDPRFT